ncbi:MAG: YcgJ family protein [Hydrogenophaga sp.]|nr:YcgJ family protein [Hydrogenophaga sp.]
MKLGSRTWVRSLLLSCVAAGAMAGAAHAKEVKFKGEVYSPESGVICDKKAGFCADTEGLAVALTKMYLGEKAEKRLMDRIRPEPGVQNYDTRTFVLTNGVACDCNAKACKVSKHENKLDAAHTKALFGK